jgi:hypothetical protein
MTRQLSLAIVGADYPNKRGPTRRFEIAMCEPGEPVDLRPEPKNPADPQAVAVYTSRSILIGYVRAERAQLVRTLLRRGPVSAIFQKSEQWGCTIRIAIDGEATLPEPDDSRAYDWPPPGSEDAEWWPDDIPQEDWS